MRSSARILLIDDNEGDIDLLRECLIDDGTPLELVTAINGEEGLNLLRTAQESAEVPDLVILDLNLPGMGGLEVLKTLKSDNQLKLVPVVVFSSSEAPNDVVASYALGANCYLSKPGEFSRFFSIVDALRNFWLNCVALPRAGSIS